MARFRDHGRHWRETKKGLARLPGGRTFDQDQDGGFDYVDKPCNRAVRANEVSVINIGQQITPDRVPDGFEPDSKY